MMEDFMDEAKLEYEDGKKEPNIKKPDKFSHRKWSAWEEMVYTYFTSMKKSYSYPSHTTYVIPQIHQALSWIGNRILYKMLPYRAKCFPLTPRSSL